MVEYAFRVDSSRSIGAGHTIRCKALADQLASRGFRCGFYCRDSSEHLTKLLRLSGHEVCLLRPQDLDESRDAFEFLRASRGALTAIVDHYSLATDWEECVRADGRRVLAIDDLTSRTHSCNWLLDQNLRNMADYRQEVRAGPGGVSLLGPKYALLRPEFSVLRRSAQVRPLNANVVVCLGGFDHAGLTLPIAAAIKKSLGDMVEVSAVVGASFETAGELVRSCGELGIDVVEQPADIASRLLRADVAIGAGGSMNWERCCLGLPSLVIPIADNQMEGLDSLCATGAIEVAQRDRACEAAVRFASRLIHDRTSLRHMSERAFGVCDGAGVRRVADIML